MFQLRCTVRDCQQLLEQRERDLVCRANHHFDQAKQGYWNLLQPQDKKSKNPGDSEDAVLARHRWLQHGHAISLIETLRPWFAANGTETNQRTLDLGCGEGSFGPALFSNEADSYCGIDLSKRAIKLAARGWPDATWVLANADRVLPEGHWYRWVFRGPYGECLTELERYAEAEGILSASHAGLAAQYDQQDPRVQGAAERLVSL